MGVKSDASQEKPNQSGRRMSEKPINWQKQSGEREKPVGCENHLEARPVGRVLT
jgi:hypothetical protein